MFELPTGPICAVTVAHRPDTRTDGIGKQEIAPRHDIDARKKPSKRSQHWHELGYENDFAAMSQKQILGEFDPTFGEPHIIAVHSRSSAPDGGRPATCPRLNAVTSY